MKRLGLKEKMKKNGEDDQGVACGLQLTCKAKNWT